MNSSIWPIEGTLTGTFTSGQSGAGSNSNEGVLHIPQTPILESQHQMHSFSLSLSLSLSLYLSLSLSLPFSLSLSIYTHKYGYLCVRIFHSLYHSLPLSLSLSLINMFWSRTCDSCTMTWTGWLSWVLKHVNYCWFFNVKSYFYIYIKYVLSTHFVNTFLNEPELTVKW